MYNKKEMNAALKIKLRNLADRYEVSSFCDEDPSQFLRWYQPAAGRGTIADVEAASFIAAMLAFGNRKQFIPKIRQILETSDRSLGSVSEWLRRLSRRNALYRGQAGAPGRGYPCRSGQEYSGFQAQL